MFHVLRLLLVDPLGQGHQEAARGVSGTGGGALIIVIVVIIIIIVVVVVVVVVVFVLLLLLLLLPILHMGSLLGWLNLRRGRAEPGFAECD